MTAYRDAGTFELSTFAKHISIAETLLGVNADLRAQLSSNDDPEFDRSYRQTWGDLWEQLVRLARSWRACRETYRRSMRRARELAIRITPLPE